MKWVISVIVTVAAMMLSSCTKQTAINGQIFIATQGGENIRLGAVEVLLIRKSDATNYLQDAKVQTSDKLKSETAAALAEHQLDNNVVEIDPDGYFNP